MERVKDLILLVYTPREDSNARGYEAWLQEIDNPFFNEVRASGTTPTGKPPRLQTALSPTLISISCF